MNRREALAALLMLPTVAAGPPAPNLPACPEWADDWNDAAATLANMEEAANRQQLPLTEPRLCYASAIQFGPEVFLIFGMRGWDEYQRHLTSGTWDGMLGHAVSRHGAAWGIFVPGIMSKGLQAELRATAQARERRQQMAERAARRAM